MKWFKRLFTNTTAPPIAPGLYHAMREADGQYARFHLRVERDGSGILIANASAAARLSPSGVIIAKGLLEGLDEQGILQQLREHFYGVDEATMRADIARVNELIAQLQSPHDEYPMFNLKGSGFSIYEAQLIAPLQATIPLGSPEQIALILERLWEIGVPNVTFVLSEGQSTADLVRVIERAEDLGMITGVRACAHTLPSGDELMPLVQAGVDHVTVLYSATSADIHDHLCEPGDHTKARALFAWLEAHEVCAIAEMPLVESSLAQLEETVTDMADLGVDNVTFVAYATDDHLLRQGDPEILPATSLPQVALSAAAAADEVALRYIWLPPVQRDVKLTWREQIMRGPRCTADIAMRVESNGDVIPPRGPYLPVGNLLADEWKTIWGHEAFRLYREKVEPTLEESVELVPGMAVWLREEVVQ